MKIIIDGKQAVMKSGSSFDLISENRLFMGRDAYTLNIAFPLRECPENIKIFGHVDRLDVEQKRVLFDGVISDGPTSLYGVFQVTKLSEVEVECQFAQGRCAQILSDPFDEVYISSLDLDVLLCPAVTAASKSPQEVWKSIDDGAHAVALPWVNESYPDAKNNWVKYENDAYKWDDDVCEKLSWQPYLLHLAKAICAAVDYECDFSPWEKSRFRHLIVCNCIPGVWNITNFAQALPHWTVSEFFEKLELFLMAEFDIDHRERTIKMRFTVDALDDVAPALIEEIADGFDAEISVDDEDNCDYVGAKRLAYKDCDHELWNYWSCDWYVFGEAANNAKVYPDLKQLLRASKRRLVYGNPPRILYGEETSSRSRTTNCLLYAEAEKLYCVFRVVGTESLGKDLGGHDYVYPRYVIQPVNVFGAGRVDDESSSQEIEFVPACVADTYVSPSDDRGLMLYCKAPSTSGDDQEGGRRISENEDERRLELAASQPAPSAAIAKGELDDNSEFYDRVFVGFWDGVPPQAGMTPYPFVDSVTVGNGWRQINRPAFDMRLYNSVYAAKQYLPEINPKRKYKFSWIGKSIPNPRAIFTIKGHRYLCEKITATFTEDGMSQLLKGEFYPVLDGK